MHARNSLPMVLGAVILVASGSLHPHSSQGKEPVKTEAAASTITPKPISNSAQKGLSYLVAQQHSDGGWGQGGGWRTGSATTQGRVEGENIPDPADLGNTCVALLALVRAGNTPEKGEYSQNVTRGARFVVERVEKTQNETLYITDVRDTQLQQKIGQYVDTFLAGLVLSELKGYMPSELENQKLELALAKVVKKIEANQQEDGTFAGNHGWASVLSQGLCSKFINRAAQQKVAVSAKVLERDFQQSLASLNGKRIEAEPKLGSPEALSARPSARIVGPVRGTREDAGIDLYNQATNVGRINFFYDSNREAEQQAQQVLARDSASELEKREARSELSRFAAVRGTQQEAVNGIIDKLGNQQFVAGFGNNGGEEFLSYMNISETLVQIGGDKWEAWDKAISTKLAQVQNGDGSWSGHHCITGRTFCTSAALLTLLADRAPSQLAAQLATQK
jgi:hypothetical protein